MKGRICSWTITLILSLSMMVFAQEGIDKIRVQWLVQDCDLSIPLSSAIVFYKVWTPDPVEGGSYFGEEVEMETDIWGMTSFKFPIAHRDRQIEYRVKKEGYVPTSGHLILQTGLTIKVCLSREGKLKEQRFDSLQVSVNGVVKDTVGQPIKDATIVAEIENGPLLCPQQLTNSSGEFSWAFESRYLDHRLNWKISKDGYLDSRGNFLIDKDKSLYVTLAPKTSLDSRTSEKNVLKDYIIPLVAATAWTAALIATAF